MDTNLLFTTGKDIYDSIRKRHELSVYLTSTVKDSNGRILSSSTKKSKSFVRALAYAIQARFNSNTADGTATTKSTDGIFNAMKGNTGTSMSVASLSGVETRGIVVGTGSNPVNIEDYILQTKIAHGVAAGQLDHKVCTVQQASVNLNIAQFLITRDFVNSSGAQITVNEVGIQADIEIPTPAVRQFLLCRDLDTKAIPNGSTLTETYAVRVTV